MDGSTNLAAGQPNGLMITRARVMTMDPHNPYAEAVVVQGDRIIYAGAAGTARELCPPGTQVIDAGWRTLLPGFIDGHSHLAIGAAELTAAQLESVQDLEALAAAIHGYTKKNPQAGWVIGSHLKYGIVPGGGPLTRHHLDAILPNQPVAIMAYDYHTLWANSLALEKAGLINGAPAPVHGVVLGEDGLPGGELREPPAYEHVLRLTGAWGRAVIGLNAFGGGEDPGGSMQEDLKLLRQGLAVTARAGITSLHNMDGSPALAEQLAVLLASGDLTARVYLPLTVHPQTTPSELQQAVEMGQAYQHGMLRSGWVKLFMDGVIESQTALLVDEYPALPGWRGEANYRLEHFTELITYADRLGLQIAVHAIGDGAVRSALDSFEAARRVNGQRDSRHRLEHIELICEQDVPRMKELGVLASMQPMHVPAGPAEVWALSVGEDRWGRGFAWETLRKSGVRLVFGSDWPVVKPDPLLGIHAALNRRPLKPGLPSQAQTLEHTLAAYTRHAAYAEFQENEKGMIRPGLLADLVLLSGDLQTTPAQEICTLQPVLTVCGGRMVYTDL